MKEGALFTNFKAATHPSQGNYVAMISGSTFGILSDKNIDLNERHIGDLLEESHRDWKIYAEGYPGHCYTEKTSGNYARKHVPFLSFTNVTANPSRCAKIVEGQLFFSDFESGNLKDFSMYIPNLKMTATTLVSLTGIFGLRRTSIPFYIRLSFLKIY